MPTTAYRATYGIYDLAANTGWVNVGVDNDTAAFAVQTIRRWWQEVGRVRYPLARRLLITADGGGSNGSRVRLWKLELQRLADELNISIEVHHLPPGTSKWNKIEHRLFSFITQNWRAKPLVSYRVIVDLIAATTTQNGLKVTELTEARLSAQEYLKSCHPAWNLVGRVHFNLAENRKDEDAPFAFLATYTTRLSAAATAQHLPLGKALQEYSGARNRERLLSLLMPVQRAAEHCPWLRAMVDTGEIFHPLRWSPQQAVQFLKDVPALESAGVVVRMPASWRMNRTPAGEGNGWGHHTVTGGDGCAARLPHGGNARW